MSTRESHSKAVLGGHETVKIAVAQVPSAFLDRKKTIDRACTAIREAAQNGAALLVFPEVWVSGYPFWTEGWDSQIPAWIDARMRFREAALVIPSDDTDRLSQAAREANIYVAIGCNELELPAGGANHLQHTALHRPRREASWPSSQAAPDVLRAYVLGPG